MNLQISLEQVIAWASLAGTIIGVYVKLVARITAIETKIDIFWRDVSYDAAKIIHHPDPQYERLDILMERYTSEQIEELELRELMEVLQIKIDNHLESKSERIAASVLLRAMQQRMDLLLKEGGAP